MAENKTANKDYSSMKKDELLALAKEMGVKVNAKTKKADIIAAIEKFEKENVKEEKAEEKTIILPEVEAEEITEEKTIVLPEVNDEDEAEDKADEQPEVKAEDKVEPKAEEKPEEKAEEPAEEKTEDEPEEKAEKKVEKKSEIKWEKPAEDKTEEKAEEKADEETPKMRTSTENKRKMKAERREAKAARKEANRIEESKKRPSNLLIGLLIFGVVVAMFAFVGAYNYFSRPASIEKYFENSGMSEMYTNIPYDEYSTITVRANDNTIKMLIKVNEDAPEDVVKEYKSEDTTKDLKEMGSYWLTSIKPETRGFGATVKVGIKQGDKTLNYVNVNYREAKNIVKEAEKKAEEEAEEAEEAEEGAEETAEDAAEAQEEAAE